MNFKLGVRVLQDVSLFCMLRGLNLSRTFLPPARVKLAINVIVPICTSLLSRFKYLGCQENTTAGSRCFPSKIVAHAIRLNELGDDRTTSGKAVKPRVEITFLELPLQFERVLQY